VPKIIKRISKEDEGEETIQETVDDLRKRLKDKQKTLIIGLVVFLAVITVIGGYSLYNKTTNSAAHELETEAYKAYYGDFQSQPAPAPDRYRKALDLFQKSYEKRSRPHILLHIANCHYELGNYDEAVKVLKDLTGRYADAPILPLSYYKLAMTYLKKGDTENALATLGNLSAIKDSGLQDLALLESGRILDGMGKKDEAKVKYKELVDRFPKSALVAEAKSRLGGS
jgi:predicted negative regulator of RcsB-dependent stress response